MLVEVGAIEVAQAVAVAREVRRHPVENHADAVLVQDVDEVHEVLRRPVARRGREVPGRLVAPRAVERVLGDRQQLDVGEPHVAHVLGELVRGLSIGQVARPVAAAPGTEMHLVDRDRRVERVRRAARGHPFAVFPAVVERPGARRGVGRHLGVEGERIGLFGLEPVVGGDDVEFVPVPARYARHEPFPDSRAVATRRQRMGVRIPRVELADHRDPPRVRRPDAEIGAAVAELAPELLVEAPVRAFLEEIDVVVREQPCLRVGWGHASSAAGMRRGTQWAAHAKNAPRLPDTRPGRLARSRHLVRPRSRRESSRAARRLAAQPIDDARISAIASRQLWRRAAPPEEPAAGEGVAGDEERCGIP